jgi:hypothetical protein
MIVLQGQLKTVDHEEVSQRFQGWTVLFAEPGTGFVSLEAGDLGAEFLVLQFGQRS